MKTMKKALALMLAFVLVMGTAVVGFDGILALKASAAETVNSADGKLHVRSDGSFTIMQVADMHDYVGFNEAKIKSIRASIKEQKPDLIVLTGDTITGNNARGGVGSKPDSSKNNDAYYDSCAQLVSEFHDEAGNKIPFAVTFGNHDLEAATSTYNSLEKIYNLFLSFGAIDYDNPGIGDVGTGCIPVYGNGAESNVIKNKVLIINSGSWINGNKNIYGRAGDDENRVTNENRYQQIVEYVNHEIDSDTNVKVIAFQHIPLQEFYLADGILTKGSDINCHSNINNPDIDKTAKYSGSGYNEACCCSYESTKDLYLALAKDNTLGVFYGHDHKNTIYGKGKCYGKDLVQGYGGGLEDNQNYVSTYLIDADGSLTKAARNSTEYSYPDASMFGQGTYISDIKLFAGATLAEARTSCTNEDYKYNEYIALSSSSTEDLNHNDSNATAHIVLGYKTSTNPGDAIRDIKCTEMINPKTSGTTFNGSNYTLVPYNSYNGFNGNTNFGNSTASSKPVYIYISKDVSAGYPITSFHVVNDLKDIKTNSSNLENFRPYKFVNNFRENNNTSDSTVDWNSGTYKFHYIANLSAYASSKKIFLMYQYATSNPAPYSSIAVPASIDKDPKTALAVPETIYLTPATSATQFANVYLNSTAAGEATKTDGYQTSGSFEFTNPEFANKAITITLTDGSIKGSITTGTTSANFASTATNSITVTANSSGKIAGTITGGTSSAVSAGNTGTITWTFKDGDTEIAKAYTTCYAPYLGTTGAMAEAGNNYSEGFGINNKSLWIGSILWWQGITGVSKYITSAENSSYNVSDKKPDDKGIYVPNTAKFDPMVGTLTATNGTTNPKEWFTSVSSNATFATMKFQSAGSEWRTAYAYGATASLVADSSRYSNINQIPNVKAGFYLTDMENVNDDKDYYLTKYNVTGTDRYNNGVTTSKINNGELANPNSGDTGQSYKYSDILSNNSTTNYKIAGGNYTTYGYLYDGTVSYAISGNNTYTFALHGYAHGYRDGKDYAKSANSIYAPITITAVNKSPLRTLVSTDVCSKSRYTAGWENYQTKLEAACAALGNPAETNVGTGSTVYTQLQSAINGLQKTVSSALVIDSNGGHGQNNLMYFKDGANSISVNQSGAVFTADYNSDGTIKITGTENNAVGTENTPQFTQFEVYLTKGRTYQISFDSSVGENVDFFIFKQGTGMACRSGRIKSGTKTFTVGGDGGDTPSERTWHNSTYNNDSYELTGTYNFRISFKQNFNGDFTMDNIKIVEVSDSFGTDNKIFQISGTTRQIQNPVREGYTFNNWTLSGGGSFSSGTYTYGTTGGILTANWTKNTYTPTQTNLSVTYEGMTDAYQRWNNVTSSNNLNGGFALFSPFKPGYKFLGWTVSDGDTPQKDVSIPKGASGSLSYTANWEEEKYENTVGSIRNGDIDKGIYDSVSFSATPTATYGQFSGTSNVVYRPTNMAQGANIDTITGVNLNYALDGESYPVTNRTVKYYPQTNVLYEIGNTSNDATGILSSGSGLESGHVWTNVTSTAANVNALDSSIYGYAQAYAGDSGYSNGSAMKVSVSETDLNNVTAGTAAWPTYRFKMVGTGFDINAHCGTDSGLLTVGVYTDSSYSTMATYEAVNPNTGKTVTQNYSKAINTYFNDGDLYQTPVVHFENMPYRTYYVECKVAYNKLFDKNYIAPPKNVGGESEDEIVFTEENGVTYADLSSFLGEDYSKVEMVDDLCEAPEAPDGAMLMDLEPASVGAGEYNPSNNSYEVTIDSVRIYNPAGVDLSSGDIYDRYTADSELNPTYSNLRAGLLTKATDASGIPGLTGTLYIEKGNEEYDDRPGIGATTGTTTAYKRNGSVNEIYLTTGSAIGLDVPATGNVHIALRSPKGGTVVAQVGSKTFTINTATELYYDVTDALTVSGGTRTLTVTLQSGDLLAIGELKTFGSAPSNAPARLSAKSLSAARIALNEAEEHPLNVPEEITFTVDFGDAGSAEITLPKTRLSFDLDEETGKWIASAKLTAEEVAALFEENADTDHYTLDNAGEITVKATQEENGWEAAEQKVITNEIAPETEDITFTIDLGKDYGVVNVVIPADELKCEKVNGVWTASANVTVEQLADLIAKAGLSDKIKADEAITVSAENVDGVWVVEIAKAPVSETPVDPGTDEPGTDEPGTDEPGTDEPGTDDPTEDEPWYSWIIKLIQKIIEFFKTIFQRIKLAISGIMN